MHTYDLNKATFRFLSPYQVMVDFLDDLYIVHRPQVHDEVQCLTPAWWAMQS